MHLHLLLFAAGIALVADPTPSRGQSIGDSDRAIIALEKLGGKIRREMTHPDKQVVTVNLANSRITDAELIYLKALPSLERLYLNGTQIFRNNLAANATYLTTATNASDDGKTWLTASVPTSLLLAGANVIAAAAR